MTLPSVDEFVKGHNLWPLLPLPMPEPVLWRRLKSCRLRQRQKRRLQVGRMLKSVICTINALGEGHVSQLTSPLADAGCRMKATAARSLAFHYLRLRVVDLARVRRGLGLTGVRDATATLLKSSPDADGYVRAQRVKQVPMIADRMVEPKGEEVIDMLSALPAEDAMYYSKEDHVVCRDGKSEAIFREIEEHYGFVGGTLEQYLKYLGRADVSHLWEWGPDDQHQGHCWSLSGAEEEWGGSTQTSDAGGGQLHVWRPYPKGTPWDGRWISLEPLLCG